MAATTTRGCLPPPPPPSRGDGILTHANSDDFVPRTSFRFTRFHDRIVSFVLLDYSTRTEIRIVRRYYNNRMRIFQSISRLLVGKNEVRMMNERTKISMISKLNRFHFILFVASCVENKKDSMAISTSDNIFTRQSPRSNSPAGRGEGGARAGLNHLTAAITLEFIPISI